MTMVMMSIVIVNNSDVYACVRREPCSLRGLSQSRSDFYSFMCAEELKTTVRLIVLLNSVLEKSDLVGEMEFKSNLRRTGPIS